MVTQSSSTGIPVPPHIPDGTEVYNSIMGAIEPDLTTENLPKLEAKYRSETAAETKVRAERYKKAFMEYKVRYTQFKRDQDAAISAYSHAVMGAVKTGTDARDEHVMSDLESAISHS